MHDVDLHWKKCFRALLTMLLLCMAATAACAESDPVLYSLSRKPLFDGKYGKLADAQAAISAVLVRCGKAPISADGVFGQGTAWAVQTVLACPQLQVQMPADSQAHHGAITLSVWKALLPNSQAPSVEDRAQTLVLTYEATDYGQLQWNFCQNKPLWSPANPGMPCYTNDSASYMTWGPRGATAGHGREIQWILWRVDQQDPSILDSAFSTEAAAARRFISLDAAPARQFLCSVYTDEEKRLAWTRAFDALGKSAVVRSTYDSHYLSRASDGAKMETLYNLYAKLGIAPTEVDFAFFLDRVTQSSPPENIDSAASKIQQWLDAHSVEKTPSNLRRAYAAEFPTANQTKDRLGRDVAFFVDAVNEAKLTPAERQAWKQRGQLSAENVGLSDERPAPALQQVPVVRGPQFDGMLEPPLICPQSVLKPQKPLKH